jgi:C4-dicarboxylate-specific signal transduction histidine kinase
MADSALGTSLTVVAGLALLATLLVMARVLLLQRRRTVPAIPQEGSQGSEERIAVATLPENLGLWRWDAQTGTAWATEHLRRILALPERERLTREAVRERIHPDDRARYDELFAAAAGHELMDTDLRILAPDGEVRWIHGRAQVRRGTGGQVLRVTGVVIDVTGRKRAEAELEHQRQQLAHLTRVAILGQLSGALAHELNQPLTSILSNAQAAQRFMAEDRIDLDEVRSILDDIVNDDRRAGEVIRRLRAMLKRGETQIQQLDIAQLIRDALTFAHSDLIVRQVHVSTRLSERLPVVAGDRVQIQQVLLNLLLNASEAMAVEQPAQRRIEISATRESHVVHVAIRDRGPGVPDSQLENVFDAFYTTKSNGLGLGLSICRSIITAHGGKLWATNNEVRGSTFHFTLPVLAADAP